LDEIDVQEITAAGGFVNDGGLGSVS